MKNFLVICLTCITTAVSGQFMTQSADGKGSIPLPLSKDAALSVDIGKTDVVLGLNNYQRVYDSLKPVGFYGVNLSGKNREGLADLFSSGDIVPEGNLLLIGGFSVTNNTKISNRYQEYLAIANAIGDSLNQLLLTPCNDSIFPLIDNRSILISNPAKRSATNLALKEKIKDQTLTNALPLIDSFGTGDPDLKTFMDSVRTDARLVETRFNNRYSEMRTRQLNAFNLANATAKKTFWPWRLTLFGMGGIQAREFKRFLGVSPTNLSDSFQDTIFRGGNAGLGLNLQVRDYWLGVTYSYVKTDNFSTLSSKKYTLHRSDTVGSQILIQDKELTAFPGKYSRVEVNELNIDLVIDLRLNKKSDSARLLLNPYLRATLFSRDTSFLRNSTDLGMGFYFLGKKRKFIGGFYVELSDVNNNQEKAKPADEMNIRPPFRKLSFGIVTKFNLTSIFNFANRKPESE
ncbi:MAG: hypothetical protein ABWZ25_15075 [Chitinophagaceae bacterium]